MRKFITKIILIALALSLIGWVVFTFIIPQFYLPVLPYMLLFFLLITTIVHAWQLKMAKKDIAKFTRSNMLITFLKLVVYSVFAVIYIAIDRENALVFVICLMIIYLVLSFIEVSDLTQLSKNKPK